VGGEPFGMLEGGYAENCCADNKTYDAYHVVTAGPGPGAPGAVLDGVTIRGGYADGASPHQAGGGLLTNDSSPTIRHCIIECNAAGNGGGVAAFYGGAPTLAHCTIRYNWAVPSQKPSTSGTGGMSIYLSDAFVTDCTFYQNTALGDQPGALQVGQCNPVITRCTFEENEATTKGGAAAIWAGAVATSPLFTGCTFTQNRVLNTGGVGGGAVCVNIGSTPMFRDCTFTGNEAASYGGGVAVTGSASHAKLVQCSFIGNTAPSGGGLSVASGHATAVNCRFLGNQGLYGGGVFVQGGSRTGSATRSDMMHLPCAHHARPPPPDARCNSPSAYAAGTPYLDAPGAPAVYSFVPAGTVKLRPYSLLA